MGSEIQRTTTQICDSGLSYTLRVCDDCDQVFRKISYEQGFLSCMAFRVYEVVRVLVFRVVTLVCLRPVVSFSQGVNELTTRQTSHANDFVNDKSNAKEKPLLAGYRNKQAENNRLVDFQRVFVYQPGQPVYIRPLRPLKNKISRISFRGDGGCTQAKDTLSQFNFKFSFEFERRPNELYSFSKPVKELRSSYRNSVVMKVVTLYEGSGVVVLVCSQQLAEVKCGAAVRQNGIIE